MSLPTKTLKISAISAALLCANLGMLPLDLQAQTTSVPSQAFNLPAASLSQTLNQLARQAGKTLSVDASLLTNKKATPLKGNFNLQQAFDQVLAGSGLFASFSGDTIVIKAIDTNQQAIVLNPVRVQAGQLSTSAYAPVEGYAATHSATMTKTDTPLLESPQSVNVVGREQMQNIGSDSIMGGLRYSPGVFIGNNDADIWESFYIRGFKARRMRLDGMKYQADAWDGTLEAYGIERIEVAKGASSLLFGGDEPGGTVNAISKRPSLNPDNEIQLEVGSFNYKTLGVDYGNSLTDDKRVNYRLVGFYKDADSYVNHASQERFFFAPSLAWQMSKNTDLLILSEIQHNDATPLEYGVPKSGSVLTNKNGVLPVDTFIGEPDYDLSKIKRYSLGYKLTHHFSDTMSLHHSLRYFDVSNNIRYMTYDGFLDDERTLVREKAALWYRTSKQVTSDNYLQIKTGDKQVNHTWLVGVNYIADKLSSERYDVPVNNGNIDLFAPQYGQVEFLTPQYNSRSRYEKTEQKAIYVQDQIKIDNKWVATLGGRYDWSEFGERPFNSNVDYEMEKNSAFTGRAGLVYLASNDLAPFVSFSQSFQAQGGRDKSGSRFEPTRGEQFEAGVRYQPKLRNTLLSASVYQLTKTNVLTVDPTDRDYRVQTGEITSKGLELEAQAELSPYVSVIAAYSYNDAKTTKSNKPEEVNRVVKDIPKQQLSLWGDYHFAQFDLPQLKAGAGLRYIGEANNTSYKVPSYLVYDLMVSYQLDKWQLQLNAKNLFNKNYVESCAYECFFGEPRNVKLTIKYDL